MAHSRSLLTLTLALLAAVALSADPPKADPQPQARPPEFGRVPFLRDYAAAVQRAKAEKKPLFVLFDEVPG